MTARCTFISSLSTLFLFDLNHGWREGGCQTVVFVVMEQSSTHSLGLASIQSPAPVSALFCLQAATRIVGQRWQSSLLSSLYLHLLLEPTMVVALFEEEVDARWEEECWSVGERSYLHPPVIPLCSQLPAPTCPPEPTLH